MVTNLMNLYTSNQAGEQWIARANFSLSGALGRDGMSLWGEGEPCVDSWHGVYCCPEDRPTLVGGGGRDLADPSRAIPPDVISTYRCTGTGTDAAGQELEPIGLGDFRANAHKPWVQGGSDSGCVSPDPHGDGGDVRPTLAKCVVVMLDMNSMGLSRFDEGLGSLQNLVDLDISDNDIGGRPPEFFTSRAWTLLDISNNKFRYSDTDPAVTMLIQHCKGRDVRCVGVPPLSCDAFAPSGGSGFYAVKTMNPDQCVECSDSNFMVILLMCGMGVGVILFLVGYAWLIHKFPDAMRGGIATFSIMYNHMQTLSIFAKLRLRWPPSVLALCNAMGIDIFSIELTRPECLIGNVDEETGGPFYLINMIKFIIILTVFFMLLVIPRLIARYTRWQRRREHRLTQYKISRGDIIMTPTWVVHREHQKRRMRRRSEAATDKVEMVESTVFDMQLTQSVEVIFAFLVQDEGTGGVTGRIGWRLAIFLLIYQFFIVSKYAFYLYALQHKEELKRDETLPIGAKWKHVGTERPATGDEIRDNAKLVAALQKCTREGNELELHLEPDELGDLGLTEPDGKPIGWLKADSFILVGEKYYQPIEVGYDSDSEGEKEVKKLTARALYREVRAKLSWKSTPEAADSRATNRKTAVRELTAAEKARTAAEKMRHTHLNEMKKSHQHKDVRTLTGDHRACVAPLPKDLQPALAPKPCGRRGLVMPAVGIGGRKGSTPAGSAGAGHTAVGGSSKRRGSVLPQCFGRTASVPSPPPSPPPPPPVQVPAIGAGIRVGAVCSHIVLSPHSSSASSRNSEAASGAALEQTERAVAAGEGEAPLAKQLLADGTNALDDEESSDVPPGPPSNEPSSAESSVHDGGLLQALAGEQMAASADAGLLEALAGREQLAETAAAAGTASRVRVSTAARLSRSSSPFLAARVSQRDSPIVAKEPVVDAAALASARVSRVSSCQGHRYVAASALSADEVELGLPSGVAAALAAEEKETDDLGGIPPSPALLITEGDGPLAYALRRETVADTLLVTKGVPFGEQLPPARADVAGAFPVDAAAGAVPSPAPAACREHIGGSPARSALSPGSGTARSPVRMRPTIGAARSRIGGGGSSSARSALSARRSPGSPMSPASSGSHGRLTEYRSTLAAGAWAEGTHRPVGGLSQPDRLTQGTDGLWAEGTHRTEGTHRSPLGCAAHPTTASAKAAACRREMMAGRKAEAAAQAKAHVPARRCTLQARRSSGCGLLGFGRRQSAAPIVHGSARFPMDALAALEAKNASALALPDAPKLHGWALAHSKLHEIALRDRAKRAEEAEFLRYKAWLSKQEYTFAAEQRPSCKRFFKRCFHRVMHSKYMRLRRLRERLQFLTKRYADHAPTWQFAVWARQFCLLFIVIVPEFMLAGVLNGDGDAEIVNATNVTNVTDATFAALVPLLSELGSGIGELGSGIGELGSGMADSSLGRRMLSDLGSGGSDGVIEPSLPDIVVPATEVAPGLGFDVDSDPRLRRAGQWQAGLAAFVFFGAWAVHVRAQPYPFPFQNRIESILFIADIIVMGLGLACSFLPQTDFWAEMALLVVLCGSLAVAVSYITLRICVWQRKRREKRRLEAELKERQEAAQEDWRGLRGVLALATGAIKKPPPTTESMERKRRGSIGFADGKLRKSIVDVASNVGGLMSSRMGPFAPPSSADEPGDGVPPATCRAIRGSHRHRHSAKPAQAVSATRRGACARRTSIMAAIAAEVSECDCSKDGPGRQHTRVRSPSGKFAASSPQDQGAGVGAGSSETARSGKAGRKDAEAAANKKRRGSVHMFFSADDEQTHAPILNVQWSDVQLQTLLGNGGKGHLYEAMCEGRKVAVRRVGADVLLHATSVENLKHELEELSALRHANLVRLLGVVRARASSRVPTTKAPQSTYLQPRRVCLPPASPLTLPTAFVRALTCTCLACAR